MTSSAGSSIPVQQNLRLLVSTPKTEKPLLQNTVSQQEICQALALKKLLTYLSHQGGIIYCELPDGKTQQLHLP